MLRVFAFRSRTGRRLGLASGESLYDLSAALERSGDSRASDEIALLRDGFFRRATLERLLSRGLPRLEGPVSFDLPVSRPPKILALVRNFAAHAAEMGGAAPDEPVVFAKLPSSLIAHGEPIEIPHDLFSRVDPEGEIAAVIGARGRRLSPEEAPALVAGWTTLNDVTAREIQARARAAGHPWLLPKSIDRFCPVGPFWAPTDCAGDVAGLGLETRVNGSVRSRARVGEMVHSPAGVISFLSRFITLEPGDLVSLGTPEGVAPIEPGDEVEVEVEKIGCLRNPVVREKCPAGAPPPPKAPLFDRLLPKALERIAAAGDPEALFRSVVGLLHDALPHFHWTGLYRLEGASLVLGPFRGKPTEHVRIPLGAGLCGQAAARGATVLSGDVTREANYLACSAETRSEIVVPFSVRGKVAGEIDVDGDQANAFDAADRVFLEAVAAALGARLERLGG